LRCRFRGEQEWQELSSSFSRNLFLGGVSSNSVSLELGILREDAMNWRVRDMMVRTLE